MCIAYAIYMFFSRNAIENSWVNANFFFVSYSRRRKQQTEFLSWSHVRQYRSRFFLLCYSCIRNNCYRCTRNNWIAINGQVVCPFARRCRFLYTVKYITTIYKPSAEKCSNSCYMFPMKNRNTRHSFIQTTPNFVQFEEMPRAQQQELV